MMRRAAFFLVLAFSLCTGSLHGQPETQVIQQATRSKSFEDVLFDLEFAITQHNFRITARNDIGRAIRARGARDFPRAVIIHFCNLTLAQEALEINPVLIAYMPCRAAVYDHGDRITVSTVSLRENQDDPRLAAFARKINGLLNEMLRFAVE
jgi:uncharacterized protein (DUF302 family)